MASNTHTNKIYSIWICAWLYAGLPESLCAVLVVGFCGLGGKMPGPVSLLLGPGHLSQDISLHLSGPQFPHL